jgi:hypothetical protein
MDGQTPAFMSEDLKGTITMLKSYKTYTVHARTFMLREHRENIVCSCYL